MAKTAAKSKVSRPLGGGALCQEQVKLKSLVQAAEPETEPPALSGTPTGKDAGRKDAKDAETEEVEVASEGGSSHGPLYLKTGDVPLFPPCTNIYQQAIDALRNTVENTFAYPGVIDKAVDIREMVTNSYLHACSQWHVKPNSKAVATIQNSKIVFTDANPTRPFVCTYDFTGAHLGDRGVICVLMALARDVCCTNVSLEKCGLHNACAPLLAEFLKVHPSLVQVDLSSNGFSFHAGQLLLRALGKRERPRGSLHDLASFQVCVNLGETALTKPDFSMGTPCGVLWGRHGRFAPSEYGKLIEDLKDTHRVRYDHVTDFRKVMHPTTSPPNKVKNAASRRVSLEASRKPH